MVCMNTIFNYIDLEYCIIVTLTVVLVMFGGVTRDFEKHFKNPLSKTHESWEFSTVTLNIFNYMKPV